MEWSDQAIVLSARPHGETAMIVTLLTENNGRHAGLVHGGQGRRKGPALQPGNHVQADWRARLVDHLGNLSLEVLTPTAALWLQQPEILSLISSATSMVEAALPERQPMSGIYNSLLALFSLPDTTFWAPAYIKWELGLLNALGYGLDLSSCAVTGEIENLAYVSPRSGRAVTAEAAEPYRDKLLPLPGFLCGNQEWDTLDIVDGLTLSEYFFARTVFANPQNRRLIPMDGMMPMARQRLYGYYEQKIAKTLPHTAEVA
ncbi:MAG: DNA repair protein RecO [Proteobacteria bacterium]|nr:DNA repair protein RecO [Pseudomonadota bacterium]